MSMISISSATSVTSGLMDILCADEIVPGSIPGYSTCKLLWTCHILGGKVVEKPVALAIGEPRKINVPGALEEVLVKAFTDEHERLGVDNHVRDVMHLSRAYGAGAVAFGLPDVPTDKPIDLFSLASQPDLYFNTFDPLNLSGSIVTNQNPNAPDFQKPNQDITAAGQPYHSSRTRTVFHGTPVYLDYQSSSFSFSGRSIFLRALYPMKSYINTMIQNDMVASKAGLLIEKVQQNGSIVSNLMDKATGRKRNLLKEGGNNQVLSIGQNDAIESLNLQNIDGALTMARDNIIADIAAATDVPAILIKDESFAKGLASGDQDMMAVVQTISAIRTQTNPLYEFFDKITMHRAWNPEFFAALQNAYPEELAGKDYKTWFFATCDLFASEWPDLIKEEESVKTERNAKKLKAMTDVLNALAPVVDPVNRANVVQWFAEALSGMDELFTNSLIIDYDALAEYVPPTPAAPGDEDGDSSDKGG